MKKQADPGMQSSYTHFTVSRMHVCITTFCNHMKTTEFPNDARGLPFPTKLLCLLHLCIIYLFIKLGHRSGSLYPVARGLAGLVTIRRLT